MKKALAVALSLVVVLSVAACGNETTSTSSVEASVETSVETPASEEASTEASTEASEEETETSTSEEAPAAEEVAVMSYADYAAAELDSEVAVEMYVQATQSWWQDAITVYGADADGAYFVYNMACSEEDSAKLTAGTKILVKGVKSEWSGEIEIADATFTFVEGADTFVAEAKDATDLLGTDELVNLQNQLVSFKDMTVTAVSYKNNEPGDDIYVNLSKNDVEYYFCLEYYLNGSNEEFYNLVGNLEVGSVVDVEGYLYWYEGANPHLTAVTVK